MSDGHPDRCFPKAERLKGKIEIEELFKNGSSFHLAPLMMKYLPHVGDEPHQVLFSVPKRTFRRAVKRNLLKRRMREAYRLHKYLLHISPPTASCHIAFVYVGKTALSFTEIEDKLKTLLGRLQSRMLKDATPLPKH